jgi:hypothetical protein
MKRDMLAHVLIGGGGVMAGFFKSPTVEDPVLGVLERARGSWRCLLPLEGAQQIPLSLFGSNREPDPTALEAARQIAPTFSAWRPYIQRALFDHYTPYAEAATEGETSEEGIAMPIIAGPDHVWAHVSLQSIAIRKLSGALTTELVYAATWDDDHMLGARFQAGHFVELCGSV